MEAYRFATFVTTLGRGINRRRVLGLVAGIGGWGAPERRSLRRGEPAWSMRSRIRPCGDQCYNSDFSRCCACGHGEKTVVPSGLSCSKAVKDGTVPRSRDAGSRPRPCGHERVAPARTSVLPVTRGGLYRSPCG